MPTLGILMEQARAITCGWQGTDLPVERLTRSWVVGCCAARVRNLNIVGVCMSRNSDLQEGAGASSYAPPYPADFRGLPHIEAEQLLQALHAVRSGDFSVRLPGTWDGLNGKIADAFNEIVSTNDRMARQLDRVGAVDDHVL